MKSFSKLLVFASAAAHVAEIAETPKKIYETSEWSNGHAAIVTIALLAAAVMAVVYGRRPAPTVEVYVVEPRGRRWVHRAITGKILGIYASKRLAVAAAIAYHTGRGPAILYVRDAAGDVLETIPFA